MQTVKTFKSLCCTCYTAANCTSVHIVADWAMHGVSPPFEAYVYRHPTTPLSPSPWLGLALSAKPLQNLSPTLANVIHHTLARTFTQQRRITVNANYKHFAKIFFNLIFCTTEQKKRFHCVRSIVQ